MKDVALPHWTFAVGARVMDQLSRVAVLRVIAVAGAMLTACQALADDASTHARNSRRQMADCIIKRMSADRMVSFNEATRTCRNQAKTPEEDSLASNTPAKTVAGH
jgi:hypothetical protein